MTILKALSCLLISTSLLFPALSHASLMSEIGAVDEFIGSTSLKNSGKKTELVWARDLSGDQTLSLDDDYKYDSDGKDDWSLVEGESSVYSAQFKSSPSYFLLKFGDGSLSADSHYLFKNNASLGYAVIDLAAMGIPLEDMADFTIGRISHIDEFGGINSTSIPSPVGFSFLLIALVGLSLNRKKIF